MPTNINSNTETNVVVNTETNNNERVLGTRDIPTDFNIEEAVIHILDKGGETAVLNEYTLDLNESIYSYLHKHIDRCFKHNKLKFGKFNPQVNSVKDISQKILRNEENIIDGSKQLANMLFSIMNRNDGIESCDLLTITMTTDLGQVVGIIKLDYANNFMHNVDVLDEKISIGITPVKTGLPDSIQKAAFIKANSTDFDLYYLDDIKKSKDSSEYNVFYWVNSFLNCEEIISAKSTTLDFIKASESWVRASNEMTVKESENIRSKIREKIMEENEISIDELVVDVFESDEERIEDFKEYMACLNFEDKINIDKPTAIKKYNKIKIQIDKDIVLTINRDSYNDNSKFEVIANDDGSVNMVIKNITNYIQK